ncbi:ROK family protein [Microbacterium saperdae]|uniref:Polyphosphate glucokinase n=1 Tax=Microbacterium saperdae TaxID=69368 RepID=A0A543BL67_9MICO|nr:ROK family protein [Microbacterium saperdae]TQL85561.1 polyphosphate glucokinase [Microbacterium saperdae]GGM62816.1 polyphosphate glucokinase [Microbacterium saperdae]
MSAAILGIDVGGTSIKGGLVDLRTAEIVERHEVATPAGGHPAGVAAAVHELAARCDRRAGDPIGICLPAVVDRGTTRTAANIDHEWIGLDAIGLFSDALRAPVRVLNDADAAGLAEVSALPASHRAGVTIAVTLGTGVGSVLFTDGVLTPNTELGHLTVDGRLVDQHVAFSALRRDGIEVPEWATRISSYLSTLQRLFSPSRFIIGGGGSIYFDEIAPRLPPTIRTIRAAYGNDARIIGAAISVTGDHADGRGGTRT